MSEAVAAPLSRLLSDERLTKRAVDGDKRAFASIFRRYHQSLYRFCLSIVGNPDDASEALQNTMIKVMRALPGEQRQIELKPWLYRIAHNESIDLLRRRRESSELDVEQIAPGYGLAEDAATRERLRRLLTDLKELPERQREVLVMRELAGLEFEEIGSALDTSGAVARQTLYEARQSLRQMEEGREMSCATVTKAISDGDGRVTRRRDVRAHLRNCAQCQAFREEIKSRQHDLAALAPLPALAAAGMLQGLVGGSHGAAAGSSLATTLGGGAAKTIGASAAAKGVATAAVVAAIGVTAADRSGVIDLGLPGDPAPKSAEPAPSSSGANPDSRETGGAKIGNSQGLDGSGKSKRGGAGDAAAAAGTGAAKTDATAHPGLAEGAHHGNAAAPAHEHPQPHEEVSAEAQGPQGEHASGQDHEKQQPEAADGGQETAAVHKQPQGPTHKQPEESDHEQAQEGGAEHGPSHPVKPTPPAHPEAKGPPTTPAPPEEAPANPPATTPGPPASTPAQQAEEPEGPPADSPGAEHRSEKAP